MHSGLAVLDARLVCLVVGLVSPQNQSRTLTPIFLDTRTRIRIENEKTNFSLIWPGLIFNFTV